MLKSINDNKSGINPLFFSGLEQFKGLLRNILVPKNSFNDGELVTGEGEKKRFFNTVHGMSPRTVILPNANRGIDVT